MKHPLACAALAAALLVGAAAPAAAQTVPAPVPAPGAPPPGPVPPPGAPGMPLRDGGPMMRDGGPMRGGFGPSFAGSPAGALAQAYQAIDLAQAVNGRSVYAAQARSHYAGAYARYRRRDARGAAAEATAAAALAQAAIDARTPSAPTGLEPPPGGPPVPAEPARPGAVRRPLGVQGPAGTRLPGDTSPSGRARRDPLSSLVALDPTLEIQTLAERARGAAAEAARLRESGDRDGAFRFGQLTRDLGRAIRGLVAADQPPRRRGGPMGRRPLSDAGNPADPATATAEDQDDLAS
ncbi:MAG: hypothetical protein QOI11_3097 [Candidatus Eremiobacteraeota bacterium]|nr:hypothetical protein [Candidatus Eremiobacteraeota bacterium]